MDRSRLALLIVVLGAQACVFSIPPLEASAGPEDGFPKIDAPLSDLTHDGKNDDLVVPPDLQMPDLVLPDLAMPDLKSPDMLVIPATWTTVASGTTAYLYSVWGSGSGDVWVVGDSGTLLHSTDGGSSFASVVHPGNVSLFGVGGSGPNDVYVAGASATLLRTTNGGASWVAMSPGVPNSTALLAVISFGAEVFVTGTGGNYAHSANSGATWTSGKVGTEDMWGLFGVTATNVYGATQNTGGAYSTVDGAQNWTKVLNADLRAVWGSGANDIYAVGNNVISHWNGTLWTSDVTHFETFQGVWGSAANNVFTCSQMGNVLHSTNNGLTWSPALAGTTNLHGIWGAGANDLYVVGATGTILHFH